MFALIMIGVVALLLVAAGGLIGSTLTEKALEDRSRRQAATQRRLNSEWRALRAGRRSPVRRGG